MGLNAKPQPSLSVEKNIIPQQFTSLAMTIGVVGVDTGYREAGCGVSALMAGDSQTH